jgi:serine/threonine-protein kinase
MAYSEMTLRVGEVVGGYRIEGVVGRGGMGVVFRARQLRLDRLVALKVISPALTDDAAARLRFEREARLAASVVDPHVVSVFDAGEARGVLFIAMELIDGTDLGATLEAHGPLVPWRAVAIVEQVAAALQAAHQRALVHRDVKPENVLLRTRGDSDHAYLTDFGLTKALWESGASSLTGIGLATPDYAAPEVINAGAIDARADVYSLGALLFTALTGQPPYPRDTLQATLAAHLRLDPPSLAAAGASAPAALLQPVIDRAMAKQPADRHHDAHDLAHHARVVSSGGGNRRIPLDATAEAGPWQMRDEPPREPRARGLRATAGRFKPFVPLSVCVVLSLAIAVVLLSRDGGARTATTHMKIGVEKLAIARETGDIARCAGRSLDHKL